PRPCCTCAASSALQRRPASNICPAPSRHGPCPSRPRSRPPRSAGSRSRPTRLASAYASRSRARGGDPSREDVSSSIQRDLEGFHAGLGGVLEEQIAGRDDLLILVRGHAVAVTVIVERR